MIALAFLLACLIFAITALDGVALDTEALFSKSRTLVIYDSTGSEAARLDDGENRVSVKLETLPEQVKNAFLAAEDKRFYSHRGIDVKRMFGALFANISSGEYSEGASTITQQLIKLTQLSPEKTLKRKTREIFLALKLEQLYSKEEILCMYLDTVYFGRGCYGIEAAALGYFGCRASELELTEAAALAAILKAPSIYAPHIDMEANRGRRNLILKTMLEEEMISDAEYTAASSSGLVLAETRGDGYGWYIDLALKEAREILGLSLDELYGSGCRIYTGLDSELQETLEKLLSDDERLAKTVTGEVSQCAGVVMRPADGMILATVGGREYVTALGLDRASDSRRQPGSLIKPIVCYAPAIDELGLSSLDLIEDASTDFNGYVPMNYGGAYHGVMTLRDALAQSVNIPAVKLMDRVGVGTAASYATNAGLTLAQGDMTLALALGGMTYGATPAEMCAAYSAIASGGTYFEPHAISKITDEKGNILYNHTSSGSGFMTEEGAFLLAEMLRYTAETGTASGLSGTGATLGAKTGTVDWNGVGNSDIWAAAFDPNYSAVIWMGSDETNEATCLTANSTGGYQPIEVLSELYTAIYPNGSGLWFDAPANVVECGIDMTSSKNAMSLRIATESTPKSDIATAFFKLWNIPVVRGTYWDKPEPPNVLSIARAANGAPVIRFPMENANAYYTIYRSISGGSFEELATLDGADGKASFTDVAAPSGKSLEYRVRATHKESGETGSASMIMRFVRTKGAKS